MDFFNGLCGLLQRIAWTSDSGILNKSIKRTTRSRKEQLNEIEKLKNELEKEKNKGFFARLFGK